jgi:hypothetical protein
MSCGSFKAVLTLRACCDTEQLHHADHRDLVRCQVLNVWQHSPAFCGCQAPEPHAAMDALLWFVSTGEWSCFFFTIQLDGRWSLYICRQGV